MKSVSIAKANILYGSLWDYSRKAKYIFNYHLENWKNERDRPPKYLNKNYFRQLFSKKIYCPKLGEIKEVQLKCKVNTQLLLDEIEKALQIKNLKPSGFVALRPPSKHYLAGYLYAINKDHEFFKEPLEEIEREIP